VPRRLAALLAAALLALAAAGCGGDEEGASSDDVPPGAVAMVGDIEIGSEQLAKQVKTMVRAQRSTGGDVSKAQRDQLETQALAVILTRAALEQEAAKRGIEVSDADVRKRWQTAAKQQLRTKQAQRRFLRSHRLDAILDQFRLQFLTERIHAQIDKQAGGGYQGHQAVTEFQNDFQQRLQDRTTCADGYTAPNCGNPQD